MIFYNEKKEEKLFLICQTAKHRRSCALDTGRLFLYAQKQKELIAHE